MKKSGRTLKKSAEDVEETEKKPFKKVDDTKGGIFDGGFFRALFGGDDEDEYD